MQDSHLIETFVRQKTRLRGNAVNFFIDEVRLPNRKLATREYLDHPGAVAALPILGRDKIVLVRQFRYPVREVTYEIPAGKLDAGERPLPCVRRELREETGYAAARIRPLIDYWPTPAFSDEVLHIFLAEGLKPGKVAPDEDEFLDVVTMPLKRALSWVYAGKIRDSKTVIALLAYSCRRR